LLTFVDSGLKSFKRQFNSHLERFILLPKYWLLFQFTFLVFVLFFNFCVILCNRVFENMLYVRLYIVIFVVIFVCTVTDLQWLVASMPAIADFPLVPMHISEE